MAGTSAVLAAQYLRMSTNHQLYSLQHQAEVIEAYAQRYGFNVVQTYSDAGRSGLRLKDRPGLIHLLNDVISGDCAFRAILVYDVSRWGRFQDCDEAAYYEFICKSAGVVVHYCAESFLNDNTLTTAVIKALKRTMAAEYSREMGIRTFAGEKRGAELGFKQGGMCGYALRRVAVSAQGQLKGILSRGELKSLRTDRVILVPGPDEEVACVREMYRQVLEENRNPYYIANELNRTGIACPTGKWTYQYVRRILTDPKYAGSNVWNRTSYRLGAPRRANPKSEWVVKPSAFFPIIDPQLFRDTQARLFEQKQAYSNEELLAGLRELLQNRGKLSCGLVKGAAGLPSIHTYVKRFGTVRRAFELAGYQYRCIMPLQEQRLASEHIRDRLLRQLLALFPEELSYSPACPGTPDCLRMDCKLISVVVCPAVRTNGETRWFIDHRWTVGTALSLLARLGSTRVQIRDYYVAASPGRRWIFRGGTLKGKRLADLVDFCDAARTIAAQSPRKHLEEQLAEMNG